MRYLVIDEVDLAVREHDGIRVVYDRRAGLTHILSPDAAAILDTLSAAPRDGDEIFHALSATRELVSEDMADVRSHIDMRLAELAALKLVTPAP